MIKELGGAGDIYLYIPSSAIFYAKVKSGEVNIVKYTTLLSMVGGVDIVK